MSEPEQSNGAAIHTETLARHYKMGDAVIRAVDGVSLEVRAGDFLALLGASGSGKSSLLNLLAGLDHPTSGAVFVLGRELGSMSPIELSRHRNRTIGMVFQSFNLLPRMTVMENVELPLRLAEVPRAERPQRVTEALERVGLAARLKHRPGELSGGEQQRVAIARALVNRPRILLADEPTGNLDSATGEEILRLISEINQPRQAASAHADSSVAGGGREAMTVVMVTHERALAERYANRIVTMADGRIQSQERPANQARQARPKRREKERGHEITGPGGARGTQPSRSYPAERPDNPGYRGGRSIARRHVIPGSGPAGACRPPPRAERPV